MAEKRKREICFPQTFGYRLIYIVAKPLPI